MLDILNRFDSVESAPKRAVGSPESANEMLDILQRFTLAESGESTSESLDKQQKSVNQLSATFKPKTVKVLQAKTDPKNPMAGKLVGGCEESAVKEDVIEKVKKSLSDYLANLENEIKKDSDLLDKKKSDTDLKKKEKKDRDLIKKVKEDPAQENPVIQEPTPPIINPTYAECSSPIKTITLEDGCICEIHGDESKGFEIRHKGRSLPSKFGKLDHALTALDIYAAKKREANKMEEQSFDYMEEK